MDRTVVLNSWFVGEPVLKRIKFPSLSCCCQLADQVSFLAAVGLFTALFLSVSFTDSTTVVTKWVNVCRWLPASSTWAVCCVQTEPAPFYTGITAFLLVSGVEWVNNRKSGPQRSSIVKIKEQKKFLLHHEPSWNLQICRKCSFNVEMFSKCI